MSAARRSRVGGSLVIQRDGGGAHALVRVGLLVAPHRTGPGHGRAGRNESILANVPLIMQTNLLVCVQCTFSVLPAELFRC